MTYRILLVDDDRLDLKLLEEVIPWTELDLVVAGRAHSARAAVEIAARTKLDIAILDVKLPGTDGLDLCASLKERTPELRVVFISAHEQFEYARRAVELQADGYLVKPVDIEKLIECLRGIRRAIDQGREQAIRRNQWGLADALFLTGDQGSRHEKPPALPLPSVVAAIADRESGLSDALVVETLQEQGLLHFVPIGPERVAVLVPARDEAQAGRRVDSLRLDLAARGRPSAMIGVGTYCTSVRGLPESLATAEQRLNRALFFTNYSAAAIPVAGTPVRDQPTADPPSVDSGVVREFKAGLSTLVHALIGGDSKATDAASQRLLEIAEAGRDDRVSRALVIHAIAEIDNGLSMIDIDLFRLSGGIARLSDTLICASSFQELADLLRRVVASALAAVCERRFTRADSLPSEVTAYVEARLSDDLSLDDVAMHFAFSGNYLSHLLKRGTGESFRDILSRLRMERAGHLLRSTRLFVYEIADRVGYRDVAYFSRLFRKHYGVSPGEYRQGDP